MAIRTGNHRGNFSIDINDARDIKHFWTKREASDYAVKIGWGANCANRYHTNFTQGWMVGFQLDSETYRAITEDENYKDFKFIHK